ncbi:MAG TPA: hypothetical protein ENJ84_12910 [Gammaproteobacteria bacterium]|nr:hypothetical protein [Gammaproteobacteria bacterium]
MTRYTVTFLLASIWLIFQTVTAGELKVEPDKENVVASRLEGSWQIHGSLTRRLTGSAKSRVAKLLFITEPSVAENAPDEVAKLIKKYKMRIYMAGYMSVDGKDYPFVLTHIRGNPHIVYWPTKLNVESFNVMLAVAKNKQQDLLFIGNDFNNRPFFAFERVRTNK